MDWSYILFNSLVYGLIAFVLATFFAYGKFLHLGVGAVMIFIGYLLQALIVQGWSRIVVGRGIGLIGFYLLGNRVIVRFFRNEKQRDLFGLIFTLGMSILLENAISYIFGPTSVSLGGVEVGLVGLIVGFVVINALVYYLFGMSYLGKVYKGIYENSQTVRSLGVRVDRLLYVLFAILFVLLGVAAWLVLAESNMRSSDAIFYLIKGIGVMILVGIAHKQYVFLGALLYVLIEYVMFIELGWPIAYKETLILVVILLILILKPEGLFSLGKRNI